MNELEFREAIVEEAMTWIGTPYLKNGRIKGVGCNCAQFVYGVALGAGVLANPKEPRWFTEQMAIHSREERLIEYVKSYGGVEIEEEDSTMGDLVLYKNGKGHGHAAIIINIPEIIHCLAPHGVQMGIINEGRLSAYSRRYFTLWRED
jgi:cell wall-associated NlpC family hydrolase